MILSAVARGMHKTNNNPHIKMAATLALINSLEFCRNHFQNKVWTHVLWWVMGVCSEKALFVLVIM